MTGPTVASSPVYDYTGLTDTHFACFCSFTFEKIQGESNLVWKMQYYDVVREFHSKPVLVPPFILLEHAYRLVRYLMQQCTCCGERKQNTNRCRQCHYQHGRKFGFRE